MVPHILDPTDRGTSRKKEGHTQTESEGQTDRQTNIRTQKRAIRQADAQTDRQTEGEGERARQRNRETNEQTCRQTTGQTRRHTEKQTEKLIKIQANRLTDRQGQHDRQIEGENGRRSEITHQGKTTKSTAKAGQEEYAERSTQKHDETYPEKYMLA